jgi:hypothetical protein
MIHYSFTCPPSLKALNVRDLDRTPKMIQAICRKMDAYQSRGEPYGGSIDVGENCYDFFVAWRICHIALHNF